ncbi:HNH endonuclease signature motif containing protein [Arthrobacter sp. NEB 688]|uniref:HNH endonuclease signature motif containing protein n=1 Tax=Arthrobacter sp. NEB 688 TaxID=904039 RepID=UPI001563266A|nr:HNH endonuclease signature motif containing protein [Arthrobacter sp. NEB 688]QKE85296.1 HNH endonuclease [Arthrobacter sp. NEB 688]
MATSTQHRADAEDVAAAAVEARALVAQVLSPTAVGGSVAGWAAALGELQSLADVVAAAQDEVVVRLSAIEPVALETGEVVETHRALGHVALDAPAVVSGVLAISAVHAERRVREAVRRAADGPEGTSTSTGLGGLHAAMAAGRLDAHRAQVVAHELEEVPAEVASGVVAALAPWFEHEDASRLRRRARRVLAAVSPDLLRQRAVRVRAASGLRRWADEPGVDTWLGTFPSEEACAAWAAVDTLAQRYVEDGTCEHLERARARALTDLVTSNATVEVHVQLLTTAGAPRVAARAEDAAVGDGAPVVGHAEVGDGAPVADDAGVEDGARAADDDLVAVHGMHAGDPDLVPRGWLARAAVVTDPTSPVPHAATGALTDPDGLLSTDAYRPGARLAALVRARDGRCRFPGCHVAARFCDLDHVRAWPAGPTSAANLACLCRRHHRVKQRLGWSVRAADDAVLHWTDPTGATRTTHPVDHRAVVLEAGDPGPPPPPRRSADPVHSPMEFRLEHHGADAPAAARGCRVEVHRPRRSVTITGLHPPRRRARLPVDPPF